MWRNLRTAALALAVIVAAGGLALAQDGYHYYDRGDYGYGYGYGYRPGLNVARDIGYQDGLRTAHDDIAHRKPYDPYPRGKYSHEDHGYRGEFGDRYAYETQYGRAYQQGYESVFRR